jgi:hypothetical protein
MSTDVPGTVGAVAAFLETDLLPGVAADRRSELRAAIKLLRDSAGEAEEALAATIAADDAERRRVTQEVAALQDRLRASRSADDEQQRAADLTSLREHYEALGRDAARRLRWQSVFPVPSTSEGQDA